LLLFPFYYFKAVSITAVAPFAEKLHQLLRHALAPAHRPYVQESTTNSFAYVSGIISYMKRAAFLCLHKTFSKAYTTVAVICMLLQLPKEATNCGMPF
jgi:hypothetical protein